MDFHLLADVPNPTAIHPTTIYLLEPCSKAACTWASRNIPDNAIWFGSSIVIEHRYVAALLAQIERDRLVVVDSRSPMRPPPLATRFSRK